MSNFVNNFKYIRYGIRSNRYYFRGGSFKIDFEGKAVVAKVDVDNQQEFAGKYGVRNIPTVLVFKGGEVVEKQVGVAAKNVYTELIEKHL